MSTYSWSLTALERGDRGLLAGHRDGEVRVVVDAGGSDSHKLDVVTEEASELVLDVDIRAGTAAAPTVERVNDLLGVVADGDEAAPQVATLVADMALQRRRRA